MGILMLSLTFLIAAAQSNESKDSDDEFYNVFISLSVSLGSQDTDIEESEVEDLAFDVSTMLTPNESVCKKSSVPASAPVGSCQCSFH